MRERPVENNVEMLGQLVERKSRGEEEEKRNLAIFKGVLAFLGVEEVGLGLELGLSSLVWLFSSVISRLGLGLVQVLEVK